MTVSISNLSFLQQTSSKALLTGTLESQKTVSSPIDLTLDAEQTHFFTLNQEVSQEVSEGDINTFAEDIKTFAAMTRNPQEATQPLFLPVAQQTVSTIEHRHTSEDVALNSVIPADSHLHTIQSEDTPLEVIPQDKSNLQSVKQDTKTLDAALTEAPHILMQHQEAAHKKTDEPRGQLKDDFKLTTSFKDFPALSAEFQYKEQPMKASIISPQGTRGPLPLAPDALVNTLAQDQPVEGVQSNPEFLNHGEDADNSDLGSTTDAKDSNAANKVTDTLAQGSLFKEAVENPEDTLKLVSGQDNKSVMLEKNGFESAEKTSAGQSSPKPLSTPSAHHIQDQVAIAIRNNTASGKSEITLNLRPDYLGRINIKIDTTKEGATFVVVATERPETRDLLQQDSSRLAELLQDSDLDVSEDNIAYDDASHQFAADTEDSDQDHQTQHTQSLSAEEQRSIIGAAIPLSISEIRVNLDGTWSAIA